MEFVAAPCLHASLVKCMHASVHLYMRVYMCMCACMYISTYIYTYAHTCMTWAFPCMCSRAINLHGRTEPGPTAGSRYVHTYTYICTYIYETWETLESGRQSVSYEQFLGHGVIFLMIQDPKGTECYSVFQASIIQSKASVALRHAAGCCSARAGSRTSLATPSCGVSPSLGRLDTLLMGSCWTQPSTNAAAKCNKLCLCRSRLIPHASPATSGMNATTDSGSAVLQSFRRTSCSLITTPT